MEVVEGKKRFHKWMQDVWVRLETRNLNKGQVIETPPKGKGASKKGRRKYLVLF